MSPQDHDASFIAEALPVFISEAHEQLAALEQLLLQLEDDASNRSLLDALFRTAHTIKGSAGLFGLDDVVAFTHHVESLLDRLREGAVVFSPTLSTLLLRCNDAIRELIAAAQAQQPTDPGTVRRREALVTELAGYGGDAPHAASVNAGASPATNLAGGAQSWKLRIGFDADIFRNGMDPASLLNYLRGIGEVSDLRWDATGLPELQNLDPERCYLRLSFALSTAAARADIEAAFTFVREGSQIDIEPVQPLAARPEVSAPMPAPAQMQDGPNAAKLSAEPRYIRVQADRLDLVINLLGELVIASAGASMLARQTRQGALLAANDHISQLVEEIRNGTLQLRMVQIGETFSRFRRVVRDTAAELGKDVALQIVGGETELDKSVVERIADPLMHLVRNALDHGLESPDERRAAGKPAQGRLTLSARHEAGSIHIHIEDDGRGVRRQKVLQRAWERGLVEPGVQPPDNEILQLIFAAGFSTADKVTNLSGRGVGMDVVRSNIEALRGNVRIQSIEGAGTCIQIRLPLTLAIIDGFLVSVGASRFIFPLDAVVEVIENRPVLARLDERGRGTIELRGQVLPVVDLRRLYSFETTAPERTSVVVLQSGGRRYGVQVDSLMGQHQTVIKPLGRLFRSLRGMSGSSILGNGEVALIFDVHALCLLATDPPYLGSSHTASTLVEGQAS